jgi:hypothetical protein
VIGKKLVWISIIHENDDSKQQIGRSIYWNN